MVAKDATLMEALLEMSSKRLGCVGVCAADGRLIGVFTDGDLRRKMSELNKETPVGSVMSPNPLMLKRDDSLSVVARVMSEKRIPSVFICKDECPEGIIHLHDLLSRGLV